jgi:hypothetical protein
MTETEQGIEKNGELREEEGTVKDEGTKWWGTQIEKVHLYPKLEGTTRAINNIAPTPSDPFVRKILIYLDLMNLIILDKTVHLYPNLTTCQSGTRSM